MKRTAIEEAAEAAEAAGQVHPGSSFSDHVLLLETWMTDLLAILGDERPPHPQRLRMAFDGLADVFRQLTAQQIIELNEGHADAEAYRKLDALKPQLQSVLDQVRPVFMQSQAARRTAGAVRASSGTRAGRPLDTQVGSNEDVAMEARLTKLESCAEHSTTVLDAMQKRMDDGFKESRFLMGDAVKESRTSIELLQKRMDDGFRETRTSIDALHKRTDDSARESRSDSAAAFREVRSEASANFRVLVGIQVTTLIAVITMLAKMANIF